MTETQYLTQRFNEKHNQSQTRLRLLAEQKSELNESFREKKWQR